MKSVGLAVVTLALTGCGGSASDDVPDSVPRTTSERSPEQTGKQSKVCIPVGDPDTGRVRTECRRGVRTPDGGTFFPPKTPKTLSARPEQGCGRTATTGRGPTPPRPGLGAVADDDGLTINYRWSSAAWENCRPLAVTTTIQAERNPGIRLSRTTDARRAGRTRFDIPTQLPRGVYIVRGYGVAKGGASGPTAAVAVRWRGRP